jgi:hypothetical protein
MNRPVISWIHCVVMIAVAALLLGAPSSARAEGSEILRDTFYEVSSEVWLNAVPLAGTNQQLNLMGIRLHERNGIGGKMLAMIATGGLMMGTTSGYTYEGRGQIAGYEVDVYRSLTPEEQKELQKARQRALDETWANDYQLDMRFYVDGGDQMGVGGSWGEGFSMTLYPWSWSWSFTDSPRNWHFEAGLHVTHVYAYLEPKDLSQGAIGEFSYTNVGVPVRLVIPLLNSLYWDNQWDLNLAGEIASGSAESGSVDSPFRSMLNLSLGRVFVRGGISLVEWSTANMGYTGELGYRF